MPACLPARQTDSQTARQPASQTDKQVTCDMRDIPTCLERASEPFPAVRNCLSLSLRPQVPRWQFAPKDLEKRCPTTVHCNIYVYHICIPLYIVYGHLTIFCVNWLWRCFGTRIQDLWLVYWKVVINRGWFFASCQGWWTRTGRARHSRMFLRGHWISAPFSGGPLGLQEQPEGGPLFRDGGCTWSRKASRAQVLSSEQELRLNKTINRHTFARRTKDRILFHMVVLLCPILIQRVKDRCLF